MILLQPLQNNSASRETGQTEDMVISQCHFFLKKQKLLAKE